MTGQQGRVTGRGGTGLDKPVLPPPLRVPLGIASLVAALTVVVLSLIYATGAALGAFDRVEPPQEGIGPPLRAVALAIDFLGEPLGAAVLVTVMVVGCLALRRPRAAALVVAGSGLTVTATTLLKPAVDRTIHGGHLSFPSGHTALLTALGMIAALVAVDLLRTGRVAGTLLVLGAGAASGAAMAWAQVSLGAHYSTDTLGGFCTALPVVVATAWLIDVATVRRAGPPAAAPIGSHRR